MDRGPGPDRGIGEPTGVAERIDGAAASVERPRAVTGAARQARHALGAEKLDRGATPLQAFRGVAQEAGRGFRIGSPDGAGLVRFALDLMLADQVEDPLGGAAGERHHAAPEGGSEIALDGVGLALEAGVDLPAVAPRCPPARLTGLEHRDVDAAPSQMERGRQAREAPTDHHRSDPPIAGERRCGGAFSCGIGVEAAGQSFGRERLRHRPRSLEVAVEGTHWAVLDPVTRLSHP